MDCKNNTAEFPEPRPRLGSAQDRRREYQAPELLEWGGILDLTQGPINGTQDGFLSGTGGG